MLIIMLGIILLLSVFVMGPLFLMAGARVLRVPEVGFKRALTVNLILTGAAVAFLPLGAAAQKIGLPLRGIDTLYFVYFVSLSILLVKRNFATTYIRSAGVNLVSVALTIVFSSLVVFFVVQSFILPPHAASMAPTVLPGDLVLVNKYVYKVGNPQRGDLGVFKPPIDGAPAYVKRVVGLPGEQLEIRDGVLLVNGKSVTIPALKTGNINMPVQTVPQGEYFMLGENPDHSYDSRNFGAVPKDAFFGRLDVVAWSMEPNGNSIRWGRMFTFLK